MSSVPLGIGALGQLMLAASSVPDISINNPPKEGFLFIKYPESLRTTLIQISNRGYEAFGTADVGMGRINNCSRQISCANTEAGKMMKNSYSHPDTTENQKFLNEYLELRLTRVKQAANICQEESHKVVVQLDNARVRAMQRKKPTILSNSLKQHNKKQTLK